MFKKNFYGIVVKNVDHLDTNSKTIAERQEFSFRKYFVKLLRFKGQLISKGLIVILNSSKKWKKQFDLHNYYYLFSFAPKRRFEINWPLERAL